jgi:hypothetical protein
MGTWEAGPFENDAALDYLGTVVDGLEKAILEFVAEPRIDDTLDPALAAVALLNVIAKHTPAVLRHPEAAREWRDAFLHCYDEQVDGLHPDPAFKVKRREAILGELDRLVASADREKVLDEV